MPCFYNVCHAGYDQFQNCFLPNTDAQHGRNFIFTYVDKAAYPQFKKKKEKKTVWLVDPGCSD